MQSEFNDRQFTKALQIPICNICSNDCHVEHVATELYFQTFGGQIEY